jgi:hypothetical protein
MNVDEVIKETYSFCNTLFRVKFLNIQNDILLPGEQVKIPDIDIDTMDG